MGDANKTSTGTTKVVEQGQHSMQTSMPMNPTVAVSHNEKPSKFTGQNFKTWQQKMLFYLTMLNLAKYLSEDPPVVADIYIYMKYGGVKAVGRWCQAVMSGGGVRRWQWWLRREAAARVRWELGLGLVWPGQNWVSTAAPLCSLLCNDNRAKTKGGPVLSGMAQLLLEVMTFISTWQDLKKFDLLIPDDEARSERKLIFSSLTMKQDLKKC
ncbi:hypothetical protein GQ457_04G030970 [Hibiscus cannabinus]